MEEDKKQSLKYIFCTIDPPGTGLSNEEERWSGYWKVINLERFSQNEKEGLQL